MAWYIIKRESISIVESFLSNKISDNEQGRYCKRSAR